MGKEGGIGVLQGYEPFGSLLPGRNYSSASYRFGFQGQIKDDEVYGATGTSYAFEYRMHDARVGRFWSIDPLAAKYPYNSPYAFAENNVIQFIELEGLECAASQAGSTPSSTASDPTKQIASQLKGAWDFFTSDKVPTSTKLGALLPDKAALFAWKGISLVDDDVKVNHDFTFADGAEALNEVAGMYGAYSLLEGVAGKLASLRGLAPAAEGELAGQASRLSPGGGLANQERLGGHTIARHVGLNDAQLASRLEAQPKLQAASSFTTRAQAEAAVSSTMDANAAAVSDWVANGAKGKFTLNGGYAGGRVLLRGQTESVPALGSRVVLQGDGAGQYKVLTAFPTR